MSYALTASADDDQTLQEALAFLDEYDGGEDLFNPYAAADASRQWATASAPAPAQSVVRPPASKFSVENANKSIANANRLFTNKTENSSAIANELDDLDAEDEEDGVDSPTSSSSGSSTAAQRAPPTSGVSNSSTPAEVPAKTGPKRVRKRQKDELIYLRSRVNELEERLERLQKKSRGAPPSPALSNTSSASLASSNGSNSTMTTTQKPSAQLAAVWEKMAARQSEQRQQSEVENAKLKEMLEEQIRVARSLEKLLRKRASGNLLSRRQTKQFKWSRNATKEEQATIFQGLLRQLEQQYSEADSIFTHERFGSRGAIFRDIQVRMTDEDQPGEEDMGEMYIDVLDSKILPFDLKSTAEAFWHHMTRGESMMTSLSRETVELTDDVMARNFAVEIKAGPMQGEFRGKQCARRYQEENRTVIVWNMLAEPLEVSGMFMGGLLVRQKAWVELTPSKEDPTQATQLRARYVMTPDVYDDEATDQDRKVGAITDFVIHSTHGNLNSSHQMIENILIQTSLLKSQQA